jgi:hypothetical protein
VNELPFEFIIKLRCDDSEVAQMHICIFDDIVICLCAVQKLSVHRRLLQGFLQLGMF